ncbi:MAG: cobyrinate a,c-diamide synthase [Bacillota bacterium]
MTSRLVIAGTRSGVGKTTISLGLMAALTKKGYKVQPYKVGPDYIDPGFHNLVTGNTSYNLDSYFLGNEGVKKLFKKTGAEADIAVIEGVMGLFDGKGKKGISSTAEIAKLLKCPVVLIIDAKKMAQSGAALAYGYKNYDSDLRVEGVILNNIASERHYQLIKDKIEEIDLEILGYLPRQKDLKLPERHLGLVPTHESEDLEAYIDCLVKMMTDNIELDRIFDLGARFDELNIKQDDKFNSENKYEVKIGIAYDSAFNFYYQYNLDLLKKLGAKLIYFSPVQDKKIPEVDGLYLGGGFPEGFLEQLAGNHKMKQNIEKKVKSGIPVYAECGGLMYLSEKIIDKEGGEYPMTGILPGQTEMTDSLQDMGYVEIEAVNENIMLSQEEKARGHSFHYSRLINIAEDIKLCYKSSQGRKEGYSPDDNILASYIHLHFGSNPVLAQNFLSKAEKYKLEKRCNQ